MPRNSSGVYTLPQAAFTPGTVIASAAVNSDLSDIASALTGSVASNGVTSITAPLKNPNGTEALPGISFGNDATLGFYNNLGILGVSVAGVTALTVRSNIGTGNTGNQLFYGIGGILCPVGGVTDFAGATPPAGWLLCSGASVLRASYPELFTVIGTIYGAADGTHFTLPTCLGTANITTNKIIFAGRP